MSTVTAYLRHAFGTRLGRNIVFWICMLLFLFSINLSAQTYPGRIYVIYKLITTFLLIVLSAVNNSILVPKVLIRKKRFKYVLAAIALTLVLAGIYVLLFIDMQNRFPGMKPNDVSFISTPVSKDWTWITLARDIVVYALGLGMWVLVFTMTWYMQDHARQEKLAREAAHKQTETELSLLRNQVNPHFLFNTLNNIYGLSLAKSDKAPESILKLSAIMRYLLYDSGTTLVPFDKEKEVMQAYIDMELLRLPGNENFQFNIQADGAYMVPPLLWLPLLENVFKHGTRMIADTYHINFSCTIINNRMSIIATNNYKNMDNPQPGGLGLSNLHKRLEILFPGKYDLTTRKDGTQYHTELTLTLS